MKILLALALAFSAMLSTSQSTTSGEQEIITQVADSYNVDESAVTLLSPDQVEVDLTLSTVTGTALFEDCGTPCTKVSIAFPDRTLNFIVEDEIQGF